VSVRAKGGSWEIRVYAGTDPLTGRKRWISRGVKGTKRDAIKAERALQVQVQEGKQTGVSGTVGSLLEEWYAQASPRWSKKYAAGVRSILDHRWLPQLGKVKLQKLTPFDLDRCYRRWEAERLEPATIGQYHAVIRRALRQGVRWGWITANVASQATPPPLRHHQLVPPTPAQIKRVIAALAGGADYTAVRPPRVMTDTLALCVFVRVAASTGARRGEVCALRADDFDESGVTISRSIGQVGKEWHVKDTKTHQGRRISLDAATLGLVAVQLHRNAERAELAEVPMAPNPYIFSDDLDSCGPWRPDSISGKWRRLRVKHGLDGVRLHDLRHYVATSLLTDGVDVRTVAGRLGHANASTTLRVYAQWSPQRDADAATMLGARLDDEPPQSGPPDTP
jgi:integrase